MTFFLFQELPLKLKMVKTIQPPVSMSLSSHQRLVCNYVIAFIICKFEQNVFLFSDCLSINNLCEVKRAVWEARVKWYDIGLELRVSPDNLDVINKKNHEDCDVCIREMLKVWLRRSHPSPSWKELAEALRSPMIDYGELADRFQSHCA